MGQVIGVTSGSVLRRPRKARSSLATREIARPSCSFFPRKIRGFCQKLCSSLSHLLGHVADVAFYSGDDFLPAPVHGMSLQLRSGQSNECEANPKIIRRGISHRISSPNLRGIDSHRYSEAFKIRPWPWKTSTEKVDGHPYKE